MKKGYPIPKKRLGQNFLTVPYYAERIAESVPAELHDTVCEIGPGTGALTVFLVKRFSNLHLIEIDAEIVDFLKDTLGTGNWEIHQTNALDFDFNSLKKPIHVAGNLPYNLASIIIKKVLLYTPSIQSITFMVQREVAERIIAAPGTKKNSFISIFCQFFGKPNILFHVPKGAFYPKPKVTSSVFQLVTKETIEKTLQKNEWNSFFKFVSYGFSMRRKTLATILSWKKQNREFYADIIEKMGFDRKIRPENLGVSQWIELYKTLQSISHSDDNTMPIS